MVSIVEEADSYVGSGGRSALQGWAGPPGHVLVSPLLERGQRDREVSSRRSEVITATGTRTCFLVRAFRQYAGFHETFEAVTQYVRRDAEPVLKVGESFDASHQGLTDDQERPLVGQHVEAPFDRAIRIQAAPTTSRGCHAS